MGVLQFEHNPDIEELGMRFPKSPYFSLESLSYRETEERNISTLVVYISGLIVGALTYSIIPHDDRLKIGLVEVHEDYLGRGLGTRLLLEAERNNHEKIRGCVGYLNKANNIYSIGMFLKAGYRQFDQWEFYK